MHTNTHQHEKKKKTHQRKTLLQTRIENNMHETKKPTTQSPPSKKKKRARVKTATLTEAAKKASVKKRIEKKVRGQEKNVSKKAKRRLPAQPFLQVFSVEREAEVRRTGRRRGHAVYTLSTSPQTLPASLCTSPSFSTPATPPCSPTFL